MIESARVSRPLHLLLVLAIAIAAPSRAWGQPAAQAEEVAKTHYDRGKSLAATGKFADAYREFEAGYNASPKPAFLFNMGEAARGMGDVVKARVAYERFLAIESTGAVADTARKRLADLGPAVGPAPPAPPAPLAPWEPAVPTPAQAAVNASASSSVVVTTSQPATTEARPLWKRWPLWAAVGGVLVAGIVVGAVIASGDEPACDAGCIDFR